MSGQGAGMEQQSEERGVTGLPLKRARNLYFAPGILFHFFVALLFCFARFTRSQTDTRVQQ
jgi:hypothetical protein